MAFPKPTKLPEWASGGTADVVEPTSGEKSLGWQAGQTPPAPYMNWLMGGDFGYYPWLQYVSTFEQQALTWPERQTFSKGFAASGQRSSIAGLDVTSTLTADKVSPAAGTGLADTPFHDLPLASPRYLMSRHIINASPLRYGRYYVTPTGFEFATNAWWNDTAGTWSADDTSSPAVLIRITGASIRVCRVATPSASFSDAAFTELLVADPTDGGMGKVLGFTSATKAEFSSVVREPVHMIGAAGEVAFNAGFGNGATPSHYVRSSAGIVTGAISVSSSSTPPRPAALFTMPVGYRPLGTVNFLPGDMSPTATDRDYLSFSPTGGVTLLGTGGSVYTSANVYSFSYVAALS